MLKTYPKNSNDNIISSDEAGWSFFYSIIYANYKIKVLNISY